VGTPGEAKNVAAQLQNIGISPTMYLPRAARTTALEVTDLAKGEQDVPTSAADQPAVPSTAAQMLRKLPPAPQSRGMPNLRMGPPPAAPAAPAASNLMYPTLFPNDPISQMLQQRQQQVGAPR
jgi:hypothetical protein